MPAAPTTRKSMRLTGIGYSEMRNMQKKILRMYHRILKASVKRKFDEADDLNWKLLRLEIRLRQLDEEDGTS